MSNEKRVFLVGFRTIEFQKLREIGVNVQAFVEVRERSDAPYDTGVETYPHFETVRCEIDPPAGVAMSAEMKRELYRLAFPMFRRHYSRTAFARSMSMRSWTNLDNLFFLSAAFYHDVLSRNRIDTVVFSNFPHEGSFIILYHLAKLLGMETVITSQSNFTSLLWIVRDIEDFGTFATIPGAGAALPPPAEPEVPFYMKRAGKFRRMAETSVRVAGETVKMAAKIVTLKVLYDRPSVDRNMNRLVQAVDRWRLGNPSPRDIAEVDLDLPFVYFPLHLQPEMTTDTWGLDYGDQLLAIEELAAALPEGMLIYAKENPVQTRFMREDSFYRRLRMIPNLRYVSPEVPSFELIRRSRCVATISGTAGWEAALMGKGAIHFGVAWYSSLPGVFRWQGAETLQQALAHRPDRAAFETAFDALSRKLYPGVVDPAYEEIVPDFDRQAAARDVAASLASVVRGS